MRVVLIAAIALHLFTGGSCDVYPVLVLGDAETHAVMSTMVPPTCTTDADRQIAGDATAPCTGERCMDVMPDKETSLDIASTSLMAADLPPQGFASQQRALPAAAPVLAGKSLPLQTHTDTTVLHC